LIKYLYLINPNSEFNMDRVQVLLKEYEMLHEDANALQSRFWTFASVILGFNTALLGGVGYFVVTRATSLYGTGKWIIAVGISALIVCIILMLIFLKKWKDSINKIQRFNYHRAREIELELGMWKNWRFLGLSNFDKMEEDHWKTALGPNAKKILDKYYTEEEWEDIVKAYSYTKGEKLVSGIINVLIALWILLVPLYLALIIFK
jgi:hypothetical protein